MRSGRAIWPGYQELLYITRFDPFDFALTLINAWSPAVSEGIIQAMQAADCKVENTASGVSDPDAVIRALKAEIAALRQQLDGFKRQLFGRKFEKRIIEHPEQLDLGSPAGRSPGSHRARIDRTDAAPPEGVLRRYPITIGS